MLRFIMVLAMFSITGCASHPVPFETGERTTAPYGYTEMIKREAK